MADEKLNILTLAMAKKYTDNSLAGAGAVAGVPCQIQSITPITGGNRITFIWKDNNNVSHTSTLDVMDGADGEENKIDSISVNGSPISIDENKNVDITVPSIEGLTKDTDLATVAKSGSYEDLSNKPEIPSIEGLAKTEDIPTTLPADGGNSDTVNNHTVETDVPTDAKFTDTVYDDTAIKTEIAKKAELTNIDALPYSLLGMKNGNTPGLIRSKRTINKLVVIGNSLTGIESTYTRQNGEEFTESRELGCCRPENQWTSTVYRYITENVNPNFVMYKCLGKDWEAQEAGTKDISSILGKTMYEVSSTVATPSAYTLEDILSDDVDAIIIDLYENMRGVGGNETTDVQWTEDDISKTTADYEKLYRDLAQKAPNAVLYQFGGFMHHQAKSTALYRACCNNSDTVKIDGVYYKQPRPQMLYSVAYRLTTSQIESNGGFKYSDLLCKAGDTVYDVDGNHWREIASNWTSHPGDLGYQNIAILVLYNLFNVQAKDGEFLFSPNKLLPVDNPCIYFPNYSIAGRNGALFDFRSLDDYNQLFDYMQYPLGIIYGAAYTFDSIGSSVASYVKITITGGTGYNRRESITPIARSSTVNNIASRCVGSLYNTTFEYLIDDNKVSTSSTFSSKKINELLVKREYRLLAEVSKEKSRTFTNIDFSGYSQIVITLFNGDIDPTLLKFEAISGLPFSFKVFNASTVKYDYSLALDGFTSYSANVTFTRNDATKKIDGCEIVQNEVGYDNCITRIYGIF